MREIINKLNEISSILENNKLVTPKDIKKVKEENYGQELILDFSDVSIDKFSVKSIRHFVEKMADEINMVRGPVKIWGNNKELGTMHDPKADGLSCIQFIMTSSILCHAIDELNKVFINIFSCEEFDSDKAEKFALDWFGGKIVAKHNITRK